MTEEDFRTTCIALLRSSYDLSDTSEPQASVFAFRQALDLFDLFVRDINEDSAGVFFAKIVPFLIKYINTCVLHMTAEALARWSIDDVEYATLTIMHSCNTLVSTSVTGYTTVAKWLDGNLLATLLVWLHELRVFSSRRLHPGLFATAERTVTIMISATTSFLTYRSVNFRAVRQLKAIRDAGHLQNFDRRSSSSIIADFLHLEQQASAIAVHLNEFLQVCSDVPCSAKQCRRKMKPHAKRVRQWRWCSRCHVATYCCERCQESDWLDGHRENCRRQLDAYHGLSYPPSNLDREFIRFLVQSDMSSRKNTFRGTSMRSLRPMIVEYNINYWPLAFRMTEATTKEKIEHRDRGGKPDETFVNIKLPCGPVLSLAVSESNFL
ncbi:hypothetical protein V5O48_011541 [Marasmius crinis-equi]|uniref:MYND-type domain-containing protein n=1 Tax=Marasmius crinis-equi TaxID=585013 RepID=A0ABR3F592_9AGAR